MTTTQESLAPEVLEMSLDPYSHTRIYELREEQLARKARRHNALGLDVPSRRAGKPISHFVHSFTSRLSRSHTPVAPAPKGRPALDS
jgi:hypothetical protein